MHLAPLGSSESIETVLDQFRRNHVTILNAGKVKDKNETAIRSLRMHGGGSLMLGCTGRTIIMWDTENFVQKGTLRLMGDINDVYDVGGDYLVANSTQSKVGVWKRDSSNFMWCFSGARQFSRKSDGCRIATAIKVNTKWANSICG
ncbi:hypothetical protein DL89DRAFT_90464 [Linderina pennispora]|uniref:WD40 repeat-like protein n=1 Tax=Linderina pennispora TaxID=61395 RepID=A0A1Y1WIG1_9FUNG|nr:uncharacterized protein DL89DRAFT_90464 [Linderina pennispora]ORX73262.1 hypothetical protein DL89DRAFT_90464 [Linderina pennispora]